MTDLISRQELREWVANWFEKNRYYHPYSKSNNIPITELYDILEQLPTIDPVKHGKWIERKVTHEDNRRSTIIADWQSAKCSNCGKHHTTPYLYYFFNDNYCPNCGATMERSEDETD